MFAFVSAVFFLLVTPGPGVLSAAAVGAAFGFRPGARYIVGLCLGNFLVGVIVVSGLWAMVSVVPGLRLLLGIATVVYLGYLAWRIATAGGQVGFEGARQQPGIMAGTTLQFINPKAYAVNTFLFSNFAFYPGDWLIEVLLKFLLMNAVWIPIHFVWLQLGILLHRLELPPARQRLVNRLMAGSLVIVVLLAAFELLGRGFPALSGI